jgi:arylsulfatase A-like enzyme/predicted Zn-dependent protease
MKNSVFKILLLIFLVSCFSGCQKKADFSRLTADQTFNFILISVDTLRADRLSCYGFNGIETPAIDEMARRGVRFERCIAQTPLTLPSHTTMLTGTYPFFHGVRDNGGFLVPPDIVTLAEIFKEKNYRTGAVVGAYVLDSKWGLNQGFDFYYDRFELDRKEGFSLADVQRPGEEVIAQALDWLEKEKDNNFFLFLHFYDPHTPYEPPSPFKEKYGHNLYLGEVAYTDFELGRLWEYLDAGGLLENTIIVFSSDHGESLGEHGESTHGFFVYEEGIRVPLIFVLPFKQLQNLSRPQTASLADLMPTVLEMANLPSLPQVQGKSLVPFFFDSGSAPESSAYSETYYPRFHYGWSDLKSIQDSRYKLIVSPKAELYDLKVDPEETANIASEEPGLVQKLKEEMSSLLEEYSQGQFEVDYKKVDEETREKLAALGYIGSFVDTRKADEKELPSPREKIHIFNEISAAKEASLDGEFKRAQEIMMGVIRQDPEIIDAYFILGNILFKQKSYPEAIRWLNEALARKPDYDFVVLNMAISYIEMGNLAAAEKLLTDFVSQFQPDSILYLTLGDINLKQEDYPEAIKFLEECLRINPNSAKAHNNLARVYLILGDEEKALAHVTKARELMPRLRNLHYNLAQIHEAREKLPEAIAAYEAEISQYPDNFNASFNLAFLYRRLHNKAKEEEYLLKTAAVNPEFPLSYLFLGELYSEREGRAEEAISLLEKAVSLGLDQKHLKLAYYLLAKIYLRQGNQAQATRYAQRIKSLDR